MSRSTLWGTYCGGSASQQLSEMQTYLGVNHLPIGQAYFDANQPSWFSGMWNTFYPDVIKTAVDGIIAVPMLVGPQPITHLSTALSTGAAITSLPINAMAGFGGITSGTIIPNGTKIAVLSGNHTDYFTASQNIAVGATSIPVNSQTPTFAYGSGTGVKACGVTVSPQAPTDTTGQGNAPTLMTLTAVGAGTWDAMFTKTFQAIAARRPNAIIRKGWEIWGNQWLPWNGKGIAAQYKTAYQHLTTLARTISPSFRFTWDGAAQLQGYNPLTDGAYPGDSYCDFFSMDIYDDTSPWGAAGLAAEISARFQVGFDGAAAHGKQVIVPEFGFWPTGSGGGGDDTDWTQAIFDDFNNRVNLYAALFFDSSVGKFSATGTYPTAGPLAASLLSTYINRNFADAAGPRFFIAAGRRVRL